MANEVSFNDAIRILEIGGRGFVFSAQMAEKGTIAMMKLINTLYLSKWRGKTNLTRMRAIKGESLAFFQVASENRVGLRNIERMLKKHGVMFAKLPDLCGGDLRTQYAFSPADAEKMQLFLQNYQDSFVNSNGKYNKPRIEVITGKDYERTGYRKTGEKTQEYRELEIDAEKRERKAEARTRKKQKMSADRTSDFSNQDEKAAFVRDCNLDARRQKFSKVVEFSFKDELGVVKEEGKRSSVAETWDKSSKDLVAISVPQSPLCVTLPNEALGSMTRSGNRNVVLDATEEYWTVNKKTLERNKLSATEIGEMFKKTYSKERLVATKNLIKNKPIKARDIMRKK